MKKSEVTQELANSYPDWSKVRTDEQSLGQQALNSIALPMERMEKQLRLLRDNQYLTTANLDEIDLTFRVKLPTTFEFSQDSTDPLFPTPVVPTVSGYYNNMWYPVSIAINNDIESFWYTSVPNRATLNRIVTGQEHYLTSIDFTEAPVTGLWTHHLNGGDLYVETTGGVQYINIVDNRVTRGMVTIKGETRKDTIEEETLIFGWDQKQKTRKDWKVIKEIHAFDMDDTVQIDIYSADFNNGPYMDNWNLAYSENRNKIDTFWDLGHNGSIPTFDKVHYQTDEWQQLILGFSSKDVKASWELLTTDENTMEGTGITVSGVDMAIQPFTDRVWVATSDNKLYLYDIPEDTVSGIDDLKDITTGAQVQFEYETLNLLLGEDISFTPWHARPIQEISRYRIWYQTPDKQKYGLLDGSQVSFNSDFFVRVPKGQMIKRGIESTIHIPTTQRGEYLVVIETVFRDGTSENWRRIFRTRYKTPLAVFDISSLVPDPIEGIDFDADQKLWVLANDIYYQIDLHTDIMLIDFENNTIYFKEDYEEVVIDG